MIIFSALETQVFKEKDMLQCRLKAMVYELPFPNCAKPMNPVSLVLWTALDLVQHLHVPDNFGSCAIDIQGDGEDGCAIDTTLNRWCVENYTGARCGETLLPSIKDNTRGELFAAVLASVVVLSVLVAGAFFFLCRKGQIPRSTSVERGVILVEANSSNGFDSEYFTSQI
ncbi:hypothetical protein lerEdw1_008419 [Lerista edwardsae]|nr:hypothetical protein lerEdw1_008419 [Lerista edwardsae]